jgi:large repetitive protein
VTYGGADSATASVTGTCRDQAGNSASRTFSLKYDATAPTVTDAQAARGPDVNGWYNHAVSVTFSGTDQTAGVDTCTTPAYGGPDAGAASLVGTCTDRAGNVSGGFAFALKYDGTAPTVTGGQPGRAADVDGWYNHAVSVDFSGSDQMSGVDACTSATYAGPDSGTASLSGTCRDRAGNVSGPFGYGLKYDQTAPVLTGANPERSPNAAGWFNRPVDFTIAASDATSGIATCPSVTYGGPDAATASFNGTCRDRAGNSANRTFGLKYDSTAPAVTGSQPARGPDVNGWYNHPVSVAFSGSDQLSGVEACTSATYGGPDGAAASVSGTCRDGAGNVSGPSAFGLKYDGTAPVVTGGRPGRGADVVGWYNHPVAITFEGADPTAGVDSCTTETYSGPDSSTASLAGKCSDKAGNLSAAFPFGLKYDATGPVVTGANPERPPNAAGWFNRPVRFDVTGTDATAGGADCPPVTYSAPDSAAGSLAGACRDRAGNFSTRNFPLKYDSTAPNVSGATPGRPPNDAGWYNRSVTVAFHGTDQLSGIDSCTTKDYAGPDSGAASVTGTCTDDAGNVSAPLGFGLRYDATAPVATGAQPGRGPDLNGWYNHPVAIAFNGSDLTSGIDSCTNTTYGSPDSNAASVSGICTDKAGNVSGGVGFGLKYDATDPAVTGARAERPPDHGDWFTGPVRFDITGTDAMSGLLECPPVTYSGPDSRDAGVTGSCRDRAGNIASRAFPLSFDATAPPLTDVTAAPGDRTVALSWNTSPDAEVVQIARTPGLGLDAATVLFRGLDMVFVDWNVENGVHYAYEVRVQDAAGNAASETVGAVPAAPPPSLEIGVIGPGPGGAPGPAPSGGQAPGVTAPRRGLIAPAAGAIIRAGHPPLLRWTPVRRARYYNMQLFRGGTKVLSAWPARPLYQLNMRWSFRGKRQRLMPGHYRWIVWPGFGPRSKTNYGKQIGRSTFEVRP